MWYVISYSFSIVNVVASGKSFGIRAFSLRITLWCMGFEVPFQSCLREVSINHLFCRDTNLFHYYCRPSLFCGLRLLFNIHNVALWLLGVDSGVTDETLGWEWSFVLQDHHPHEMTIMEKAKCFGNILPFRACTSLNFCWLVLTFVDWFLVCR